MGINIQNFKGNNVVDLYYNKETRMDIMDCPERFYIKPLIWFQNVRNVDNKWYINIGQNTGGHGYGLRILAFPKKFIDYS